MILSLINNTNSIKTYASGTVTLPANGNVTVLAANQLATAIDGNLFADVSQNSVSVSDSVNVFVGNDGLVYLNRIVVTQLSLTDGINGPVAVKPAVTAALASDPALVVAISPNSSPPTFSDKNSSGTISALNGTVVATTGGCSSVTFDVVGTWVATLIVEATTGDGNWFMVNGDVDATDTITSTFTVNTFITIPCGSFTQVRLRASLYTSGTANINWNSSAGTNIVEIFNTNPTSFVATVRLNDGSGNTLVSNNSQLQIRDVINTSGQNRAQSVTTSAAEALGGATILSNRKMLSITPTNGTVYWGFISGVTTSTGSPIFKNQLMNFSFTDNIHVYLISAGTVDCRIAEGS